MWSWQGHRPFTSLSPTVGAGNFKESSQRQEGTGSEAGTPAALNTTFMPPGFAPSESALDSQYPTPNLYDLVLLLNLEPGLHAWWNALSRLMVEFYGAERMSLALPTDAGELENVPWGQKATFNLAGPPHLNIQLRQNNEQEHVKVHDHKHSQAPLRNALEDTQNTSPKQTSGTRPALMLRHSYGGYERETPEPFGLPPASPGLYIRPHGPLRTKSHASHLMTSVETRTPEDGTKPGKLSTITTEGAGKDFLSFSDSEFSSVPPEQDTAPFFQVLTVLRALNFEAHALLEASSVNRVLDRCKLVALTRDYSNSPSRRQSAATSKEPSVSVPTTKEAAQSELASTTGKSKPVGKGMIGHDHLRGGKSLPNYEEYEQFPCSPWAQSPAPSPAVQADAEKNPFFTETNVDEESFRPPATSPDYSTSGQVEAIGIDKASTIIHIPLIHPRLSSNLPFRHGNRKTSSPSATLPSDRAAEGHTSPLKKSPIAILSFSMPTVPYPQNLVSSLQLFAPHLATSFEIAQQYTIAYQQNENFQQRRSTTYGLGTSADDSLGDLIEADIDVSIDSTSLTSPSDYSGRSRQSPGGSIGTPGLDPTAVFSGQLGINGTPGHVAGSEAVDSYFDAKRRTTQVASGSSQSRGMDSPTLENDPPLRLVTDADDGRHKLTSDIRAERRGTVEGRSLSGSGRRPAQKSAVPPVIESRDRKHHSLLHSYGADFSSTFQTLPNTTTPARTPGRLVEHGNIVLQEAQSIAPPSERLLRTIIDSLPVQIFTAKPGTGELTWVNSKFIVYRGQEPTHIIQNPWQTIHLEDRENYMGEWQKSLGTGQPFSHKVRLRRFDGAYRWFYVRATPLKDKKQKIVHWTGTYMDIHEQHLAEVSAARQQETAASEAKYRALANSSPQIVFAATRSRGVTFCNSQWVTYSGQTEAEATGPGFMDHVHADDLAKCRLPTVNEDGSILIDVPTTLPPETKLRAQSGSEDSSDSGKTVTSPGVGSPGASYLPQAKLYKLASTGILKFSRDQDGRPSYSTEVRLRSKDNNYRWHLVRVLLSEPVRNDGSEEETWYGTCTDINDHKLLEQTLKDTMDAKSRFLSNMSHEIRTPLNGITGMVNFLIDSKLTPEQMEHVNIIRNSTEGLRDLINDILDLSKVEAGMITLSAGWMHIRSLIEEVNDIMFALAVDKGLELNYVVAEDVPSMVKGDRFRIRQILLNVVGNAIKFTQRGEVVVKCDVQKMTQEKLQDNEIVLFFQVVDTGIGFTKEEAEFLFKRFSQIDIAGGKNNTGTGLGLAISTQLVELHGGRMEATSIPGKGSTFWFTIKAMIPSVRDRPPLTAASSDDSISVSSPGIMTAPQSINEPSQGGAYLHHRLLERISPTTYSPTQFAHLSSAASSGSSDPSNQTGHSSLRSQGSSVSSFVSESAFTNAPAIALELPLHPRNSRVDTPADSLKLSPVDSVEPMRLAITKSSPLRTSFLPTIFSILVICPLMNTRDAIVKHIEMTIPKTSPHHITARHDVEGCRELLAGEESFRFTHIVVDLTDSREIVSLLDQVLASESFKSTNIVIITDVAFRRELGLYAPKYNHERLETQRRVRFVFKPLKPSKLAVIFDPRKEGELSNDRNQDTAQAMAVTQKQIFDHLKKRLGDRGFRVLLVEDNITNQMVSETGVVDCSGNTLTG
jgi:PAS domain S-box-containing protein